MRSYTITTGVIFSLLTIVHAWRMIAESSSLMAEPWYLGITALALALSIWAWTLVARSRAN
jgi:hypothetical protein